jgi:hypothetical protein
MGIAATPRRRGRGASAPWRLIFVLGCSGKHAVDDRPPPRVEAAGREAGVGSGVAAPRAFGDVQVRVEWHDLPIAARASPGRNACDGARAAAVAPTATWGIPDVVVIVDGAPPRAEPASARVVARGCAIAPRVAIAGAGVAIASGEQHPIVLALARDRDEAHLGAAARGEPIAVALPIAGHEVTAKLDAGAIYELAGDGFDPAWIVADASAAITEATGQIVVRDVPVGAHAVTAWLPPRGGQPALSARATAEVKAGALVEVTVELAP